MNPFTDRAETRVPMERRRAVLLAMAAIRETGDPDLALEILLDSVHRQARWSAGLQGAA